MGQHPGSQIVTDSVRVLIMAKGATTVHDLDEGTDAELPDSGIDGTTVAFAEVVERWAWSARPTGRGQLAGLFFPT